MKNVFKLRSIVLALLLVTVSIGAISAKWTYPVMLDISGSADKTVDLANYQWHGSEILPDDVEGEDHAKLISTLISDTAGLNNPNSDLSSNVNNRVNHWIAWRSQDYYGSMDGTWFDNDIDMEGVFSTETLGLAFIIQVVTDTQYYIYTTDVDLGENGAPNIPVGEWIYPVYRTEIVRESVDSPFDIVETKRGKAQSMYYEQILLPPYDAPSFDIDTWVETTLGASADSENAINTFPGDSGVAYPPNSTTPVYYRLKPTADGTLTVSSTRLDVTIQILSSDGTTVIAEGSMQTLDGVNTTVASFTAAADTEYYIVLRGANSIPFSIQ